MDARDIMTRSVISVRPSDTIKTAIELMLGKNISGLPVMEEDGRLVGIVTEGDFLHRAELGTQPQHGRFMALLLGPGISANEFTHSNSRRIAEVMTRDPVTVASDVSLSDVVMLMEKHRVKRLPVLEKDRL